ncbi:MAG TPA: hypothetical protein VJP87_11990, partial [Candidatus Acidoferrales bacterium]|nr:hypothetical protein [Candidatus Acidoferrales bacterium]
MQTRRTAGTTGIPWIARIAWTAVGLVALASPGLAQRRPVLDQIDLPHPYYFREMYLPQLTTGPSSLAWSPDSQELVYSMAGSLWRQKLDSSDARQLTDGPGYDYQPDWSPDGKSILYVSYQKSAVELWLLDLASGKSAQLTRGGAVNLEPRWSPDGRQIVFVSTSYNKRFHIFRGNLRDGKLENVVRLTGENKSSLPRYYYSAYDMEISPVWSRDGSEILFVSNRGHIHGTGGFWRMKAEPGAAAREIHYEETNWKARPDFSPDGSRIVYSSYLGRQWHQLWLMPANGGDAFPATYGAETASEESLARSGRRGWDETSARWCPDSKHLAFVSNRSGNTAIFLQEIPGGKQRELTAKLRHYLHPVAQVSISVEDEEGSDLARISVTDASGRFWAPKAAWIQADDSYDRSATPFEAHYYFNTRQSESGDDGIDVPAGEITIDVMKGFERRPVRRKLTLKPGENTEVKFELKALEKRESKPYEGRWVSADLHVHMNYGGAYVNEPRNLRDQAEAEGLSIVNNLVVNKEQRFPDIAFAGKGIDTASDEDTIIIHGQEFHTSYWGHRGLLAIKDSILLPGYAGYPNTAAASLLPMNADVYDMA